uniref:Uncharacterized protein n=1 Tax=Hyaloperonospora arabidopsidis (strain Emoy2) TaxID=559515 RepID=M4B1Z9_HYAAE
MCSRVIASRLEMYDSVSGSLLHSLQFAPSTLGSCGLSQWEDQHVITGTCSMQICDGGPSLLLCHDASSSVVVVAWPFLDFVAD